MLSAEPNAAHRALARWDQLLDGRGGSLTVLTQNIDGLHQRAGSTWVLEAHGTILKARRLRKNSPLFNYMPGDVSTGTAPPVAPDGSTRTRPDIVLFGERPRHMQQAVAAIRDADLVIFTRTSGLLDVAHEFGVPTMLFNQTEWEHGRFDVVVIDDVLALDQLVPHSI